MKMLLMRLLRLTFFLNLFLLSNFLFSQTDLTVIENYPDSICNPGGMPLSVTISNQGGNVVAAGNATISWTEVGSGTWHTETVNTPLNVGPLTWTFGNSADLSTCGPNTFQVAIESPFDTNGSNDTLTFTIFSTCVNGATSLVGDTICATQNQQLEVGFSFSHFNPAVLGWFASNDGGASWSNLNSQSTVITYPNPQNGTIVLAVFDGGGICPNDSIPIVLYEQQSFIFEPGAPSSLTACTNDDDLSVRITHGNGMNDNIHFTTNGGGVFDDPFNDTTYYNFSSADYSNNNIWIYAETVFPSQCPYRDSIPLVWQQAPNGVVTSNGPFCSGDTASFSVVGGFQYFWYTDPNNTTTPSGSGSSFSYVVTQPDTLVTFVIAPNLCADTVVTINNVLPSPQIDAGPDLTVCPGDAVQLSATDLNGGGTALAWNWTPADQLNSPNIQDPIATVYEDGYYIVQATASGGCTGTDTLLISFPNGLTYDHFPDTMICPGTTIILETNTNANSVLWSPNQWISNVTDPNPEVTPGSTIFYVVEVNGAGCSFMDSIKVSVDSLAAVIFCDSVFCFGEEFNASINGPTMSSYFWMVDGNAELGTTSMIHQPLDVDSMLVQCEMTTMAGCTFMLSRMVYRGSELECGGEINNAFSPNGDGINDTWVINVIDPNSANTVEIFTRYGDKLVSFENYDNVNVVWDGSNASGKKMPSGTYYYVIEADGQKVAGWVNISE